MANIQKYLDDIYNAVYGEDVRSAIHDSIDVINKVGEKTFTLGTAVTDASSSVSGFFDGSVYLNTSTSDVWRCNGQKWVFMGNIRGRSIAAVNKISSSYHVDTYAIVLDDGKTLKTFTVTNATQLASGNVVTSRNTSTSFDGMTFYDHDLYINTDTWTLWECIGPYWFNRGSFKSFAPTVDVSKSGRVTTITIVDEDKTSTATVIDAFVPTARVVKSNDQTTITITDENGTTSESVIDGYSPIANINKVGRVATITITDKTGTTKETITEPFVPIVTVTKNDGVSVISITDENGTTSESVLDGYSPSARVSKSDGVATITVTDKTGTSTESVSDGYSPTVSGVKEGKVLKLTITDLKGDHVYEIKDGDSGTGTGDMLASVYDPDGDGIVDVAKDVPESSKATADDIDDIIAAIFG